MNIKMTVFIKLKELKNLDFIYTVFFITRKNEIQDEVGTKYTGTSWKYWAFVFRGN